MEKTNNITLRLFRKSTQQLETFCLTPQNLYVGCPYYVSWPLSSITECSYHVPVLSIKSPNMHEEFDVEDIDLVEQIQTHISNAQRILKYSFEETAKQLKEGVYFVACIFVDAWNTNRSKRTSLASWSTFNGKEKKLLWVDKFHICIGSSKANLKKGCRIPLSDVQRILLEEYYETGTYRMAIFSKKEGCVSLYSSDFFKIRECVVGLENLCLNTKKNSYIGKPHSRIGLLFQKAVAILKVAREENGAFKNIFETLKSTISNPVEIQCIDEESSVNDFNDTKKLSSQLLSSVNPQHLIKENKGRIRRQLSIYSYRSEQENPSETMMDLRSTSGLFRARLSPIKTPVSVQVFPETSISGLHRQEIKVFESCCSDSVDCVGGAKKVQNESSYIRMVEESSKAFADHSFSIEKGVEIPLLAKQSEVPFETARFQKPHAGNMSSRTEREFEHSLKNTMERPIREESKEWEESCGELLNKYTALKAKAKLNKELIQKQNVKLGTLMAKCEMQEQKINKIKVFQFAE